jgi:hypothetical protein
MNGLYLTFKRVVRGIGHEIAEPVRFGAIPSASAPVGQPAQTPTSAAVAGMTVLAIDNDREPPASDSDEAGS